jgi:hypothetical protein
MNKLALLLGLALSSTAFAAAKVPAGNGNFRRAEVLEAAGADAKTAKVIGLATSNHRLVAEAKGPTDARVLFVQNGTRVTMVKAPTDPSQRVTKLGAKEAGTYGLVTQAAARRLAEKTTGGVFGEHGRVTVVPAGMGAKRASYLFTQTSPATKELKYSWGTYTASDITRAVSVTGKGESVTAKQTSVITPVAKK